MQTVAELPEFIRRVEKLLGESERRSLITHLAEFPKSGVLIRGTGGIRKLRWARKGSGKSGGVRVVYYFHDERIPLYLLTVFGKGEQSNLSQTERNELARLVKLMIQSAGL
jgi:hypothetical protein